MTARHDDQSLSQHQELPQQPSATPSSKAIVVAVPRPPQEQENAPPRDEDALALQPLQRAPGVYANESARRWLSQVFSAQRQLAGTQASVVAFLLHHSLRSALAAQRRRLLLLEAPPAGYNGSATQAAPPAAGAATPAAGAGPTPAPRPHQLRGLPPLPPPPQAGGSGSLSRGISPAGSGALPAGPSGATPPDGFFGAPLPPPHAHEQMRVLVSAASTTAPTVTISPEVSPRVALQPHTSAPLAAADHDHAAAAATRQAETASGDVLGGGAGLRVTKAPPAAGTGGVGAAGRAPGVGALPWRSHRSEAQLGSSGGGGSSGAEGGNNSCHPAAGDAADVPQCIRMGVSTSVGQRSSMEDFAFAMPLTCPENVPSLRFRHGACFGVFDGHGGHEVAQSLAQHVPDQIQAGIHHIATEGAQQMGEILLDHERRLKRDPGIWSPSSSTSSLPAAAAAAVATPSASTPVGRPPAVQSPSLSASSAAAGTGLAPSNSFGKRSSGGPCGSSSRLGALPASVLIGGAPGGGGLLAQQQRAATASPMGGLPPGAAGMRRLHTSALSLQSLHQEGSTSNSGAGSGAGGPAAAAAASSADFGAVFLAPQHGVTIEELPPSDLGAGASSGGGGGGVAVVVTTPTAALSASSMSCPSHAAHVSVLDAPLGSGTSAGGAGADSAAAVSGGAGGGAGAAAVLPPVASGASCGAAAPSTVRTHVSSSISGQQHLQGAAAGGTGGAAAVPHHAQLLPPHVRSQSDIGLAAWDTTGVGPGAQPMPSAALQLLQQQAAATWRGVRSDGGGGGGDAQDAPCPPPKPPCPPILLPGSLQGSPQQQQQVLPIVTSPTAAQAAQATGAAAALLAAEARDARGRGASPVIVDVTTPQQRRGAAAASSSDGGAAGAAAAGGEPHGRRAVFEVEEPPEADLAAVASPPQAAAQPVAGAPPGAAASLPAGGGGGSADPREVPEEGMLGGEDDDDDVEVDIEVEVEDGAGLGDWEQAMHGRDPGSTALVATVIDCCMFVANVGDCRLIVAERDARTGLAVPRAVTNDHVPSNKEEAARLAALQVPVSDDGYVGPGAGLLAVCRSIGDFSTKEQLGEKVILSEPELHTYMLTRHSLFAVASSDGITCAMKDEEIVNQVCRFLHEPGPTKQGNDPKHAAEQLVRYAIDARNSPDNASAVVVLFTAEKPPLPVRPRRFGLGAAATVVAAVVDVAQPP